MENAIETIQHKGMVVKIYLDDDPESPREWDNLGTMVCFHGRHNLGDKHDFSVESLKEHIERKDVISLPLYLFDHSGLTMSTNYKMFQAFDSHGWDWGQVGHIVIDAEKVRKEYDVKRITKTIREKVIAQLQAEVETYNQYLQGDIYGFVVENPQGDHLESCWGHYGKDYCIEEGKSIAEYYSEEDVAISAMH